MRASNRTFIPGFRTVRRAMRADTVRGAAAVAAAFVAAFAGMAGGCAGKHANDPGTVADRDRGAELARAQRLQEQAFSAQRQQDYARAIELYGEALRIDSGLGAAWHNAAICFMEERRYIESRDAFLRAAEMMPTDPRPYENLGVLYLERLGHARQAYEAYGRALERDPYSVAALRGSASSIRLLRLVSTDAQSRLQRGLEVESDTRWREIMTTERIRVEAGLIEESRR